MLHCNHFPGKVWCKMQFQVWFHPSALANSVKFRRKGNLAMHNNTRVSTPANISLRSAFTFLVVGGFTTGIQYLIMALLIWAADLSALLASSIGFVVSAVVNYLLNARLTFRSKKTHANTLPRFVVTASIGLLLNFLVLKGLTSFGMHVALAQVITTICVLIWNYTINAIWTFKH